MTDTDIGHHVDSRTSLRSGDEAGWRLRVLGALRSALPEGAVVTDPDILKSYSADEAPVDAGTPLAMVRPTCTDEVVAIVKAAARHAVPVVTRGAGSGLSGGATAIDGCIILSTSGMNRVIEIAPLDRLAVVQPGVVTADLRSAVEAVGMFYPPDPGSVELCTIGGNVATNAGGMCCVKYGVTGDFVRRLEVVLADGRVLRTGSRSIKGVAGYDLTSLFVGSEGTLGVITEITVSLVPRPAPAATVVATFSCLDDAAGAVEAVLAGGFAPSIMELLDHTTLAAIDDLTAMGISDGVEAMLLLQSDTSSAGDDADRLAGVCHDNRAVDVVHSDDPDDGDLLMEARRQALPALERLGGWVLDDVAVPPSRLVEMIRQIQSIAARFDLTIGVFGHAGDGNLHPTIIYDPNESGATERVSNAFDAIVTTAIRLGGTITGEHGIGRLKTRWLGAELGPVSTDVHRSIKHALDPSDLLNPGAALPTDETEAR